MIAWTPGREGVDDPDDPTAAPRTLFVIRSDDGATLAYSGNIREGARIIEYRRGALRLRVHGEQAGPGADAPDVFSVLLSHDLEMHRLAGRPMPDADTPRAAEDRSGRRHSRVGLQARVGHADRDCRVRVIMVMPPPFAHHMAPQKGCRRMTDALSEIVCR
jgi:hypothetical protein